MPDEATWKRRFALYTAARFGGLGIFLLGVAIAYSDMLRPGGWPQVGAIIAIFGVIDALFAPRLLKRAWEREDAGSQ
ncbi:hypothetical protein ACUXST_002053 [Sphingomonas sp. F9_3S_D5_B_2]